MKMIKKFDESSWKLMKLMKWIKNRHCVAFCNPHQCMTDVEMKHSDLSEKMAKDLTAISWLKTQLQLFNSYLKCNEML